MHKQIWARFYTSKMPITVVQILGADHTAAAAWRHGRPNKVVKGRDLTEAHPQTLGQQGGEESSVAPDLGEAGCQVTTVLVHPSI